MGIPIPGMTVFILKQSLEKVQLMAWVKNVPITEQTSLRLLMPWRQGICSPNDVFKLNPIINIITIQ